MPQIFSSNMVIQQNTQQVVWGTADPGESVAVSFQGKNLSTQADADGRWAVTILTGNAGGPYELVVKGKNRVVLENILLGDVWVCAGQSNMEMALSDTTEAASEIANCQNSILRVFQVPNRIAGESQNDLEEGAWLECNPENAPGFSAIAYYFAQKINDVTGTPIGVVCADWGATRIEAWTSRKALTKDPDWLAGFEKLDQLDQQALAVDQAELYLKYYEDQAELFRSDFNHPNLNPSSSVEDWKTVQIPEVHHIAGTEPFNCVRWYRKQVRIPEGFDIRHASIHFDQVTDNDVIWVNGQMVGATYYSESAVRDYLIPESTIKASPELDLVIRLEVHTDNGGFLGDPDGIYLTDGASNVSLAGDWKMKPDPTRIVQNPWVIGAYQGYPNLLSSTLYNGMIHPLQKNRIRGVIWYQGESNAYDMDSANDYENLLRSMIGDWRLNWNQGDFPFYIMQLTNFDFPGPSIWSYLREAQGNVRDLENVEIGCSIDLGDSTEIHPKNKKDFAERLAAIALNKDYNLKDVAYLGPKMKTIKFDHNKAVVTFDVGDHELSVVSSSGDSNIAGFELAGDDREFYPATARIISHDQVEVYTEEVEQVAEIRYLWANDAEAINLFNTTGLPAEPFRSDDW